MSKLQYDQYDVMVIGGGQAALAAAISAKEEGASVALVTKGKAGLGGSSVISDSVHSVIFSPGDSPDKFLQDIVEGGRHLSDKRLARALAEECTVRVNELESKFGITLEREQVVITPAIPIQGEFMQEQALEKILQNQCVIMRWKLELIFMNNLQWLT